MEEETTMPERGINERDKLIANIYDYEETNPWHCHAGSSNLAYEFRANGWVHVPDDTDAQDDPYCPEEARWMLRRRAGSSTCTPRASGFPPSRPAARRGPSRRSGT